jgi:DNA damage-binding protein 1
MSYKDVPTRDLEGARAAYEAGDVEASRAAHNSKIDAEEQHNTAGDSLKSVVYGGLDGIITTFAVVAGSMGGNLGVGVVIVLGFSNLIPNALSMGLGDAMSTKAENEYILAERAREEWEMDKNKQGEIDEMVGFFTEKGMSEEDATEIMECLANNYPDVFIDLMMKEELDMTVPEPDENPFADGAVTFFSFILFGAVPLLGYPVAYLAGGGVSIPALFAISCVLTALTLFALGAIKTKFTSQLWWKGGLEILIMGSITAAVAYAFAALIHVATGHAAAQAAAAAKNMTTNGLPVN